MDAFGPDFRPVYHMVESQEIISPFAPSLPPARSPDAPHPTHPFFRASVSAAPASAHVTSVASHRLYLALHPGHWTNVRHAPYSLTCNEPRENWSHRQSRLDIVIAERGIRAVSRKAAALFATTTIYVNVLCIDSAGYTHGP
jgi:hypothetical protein